MVPGLVCFILQSPFRDKSFPLSWPDFSRINSNALLDYFSYFNVDSILDLLYSSQKTDTDFADFCRDIEPQLFEPSASKKSICFPLPDSDPLNEQVKFITSSTAFAFYSSFYLLGFVHHTCT
jgi:hypothetical protein